MRFRPLASGDRAPLERVLRATGAFNDDEVAVALELIDIGLAGPSKDYHFLVAEAAEGRLAGYACYGPAPMTDGVWDLYWIAVDPHTQRKGLGKALLAAVEAAVGAAAGRMLLIETAGKDTYGGTRGFYASAGYKEVARVPDFYSVGDDKVIYALTIKRGHS